MCLFLLNSINDKVYLWFWFYILAIIRASIPLPCLGFSCYSYHDHPLLLQYCQQKGHHHCLQSCINLYNFPIWCSNLRLKKKLPKLTPPLHVPCSTFLALIFVTILIFFLHNIFVYYPPVFHSYTLFYYNLFTWYMFKLPFTLHVLYSLSITQLFYQ